MNNWLAETIAIVDDRTVGIGDEPWDKLADFAIGYLQNAQRGGQMELFVRVGVFPGEPPKCRSCPHYFVVDELEMMGRTAALRHIGEALNALYRRANGGSE